MENQDFIHSVRYVSLLDDPSKVKLIVRTNGFFRDAVLTVDGRPVEAFTNLQEPFAPYTHGFLLTRQELDASETLLFSATAFPSENDTPHTVHDRSAWIARADIQEDSVTALYLATDSGYTSVSEDTVSVTDGLTYTHLSCKTKENAPVELFLLRADTQKIGFEMGVTDDGQPRIENGDLRYPISTVEDMALSAMECGLDVRAATNADFFDMFGDNHPSSLCVRAGKLLSNIDPTRPFFGTLRNGTPVIDTQTSTSVSIDDLAFAVSGSHIVLKDGELRDIAFCEPFGERAHPRTAIGICADNTVLVLVVDGRLPDYSNGATLTDLALFLRARGAHTVINLDGGGSSICLIRPNGEQNFMRMNRPADLMRPDECLIRKGYNSILLYKK